MRLPKAAVPLLGVGLIFAAVAVAMATNTWISTGRDEVERKVVAGTIAPEDIKGWMTLKDVARTFGLDAQVLASQAGLPADFGLDQPLREAEREVEGFEMERIRTAVAQLREGAPASPAAPSGAPAVAPSGEAMVPSASPRPQAVAQPAAQPTGQAVRPGTGVKAPAAALGVPSSQAGQPAAAGAPPVMPAPATKTEAEAGLPTAPEDIRGMNTLAEVAKAFNLSTERLKAELGFPADADVNRPLREFKSVIDGFEVEQVREVVQGMVK